MQTQQYDSLYLFINGQWLTAGDRDTSAVINPANGTTLGRLPLATNADLDQVLITAGESFHVWRNTVPDERARIMKKSRSADARACRTHCHADDAGRRQAT
ncbi:aldehyde dehydrogenase family protein [Dickeya ananatis]